MTVLTVLGVLLAILVIYLIAEGINNYSLKRYSYEFFDKGLLFIIIFSYWLIYFGHSNYVDAIQEHGDLLNGELLMGLGALFISLILFAHIRNTSFFFGVFMGAIQLAICVPLAIIALFVSIALGAWLSNTKPVYRL